MKQNTKNRLSVPLGSHCLSSLAARISDPAQAYAFKIKTGGFTPHVLNKKLWGPADSQARRLIKNCGVLNKKTAAGFVGIGAQVQFFLLTFYCTSSVVTCKGCRISDFTKVL